MTIQELNKTRHLSVRTFNVCKSNDLDTLDKILEYNRVGKSFRAFRNSGVGVEKELLSICKDYGSVQITNIHLSKPAPPIEIDLVETLASDRYTILNNYFVQLYQKQSNGIKTIIENFTNQEISVKNYYRRTKAFSANDFFKERGVGKTKLDGIIKFNEDVLLKLEEVIQLTQEDLGHILISTDLSISFNLEHSFWEPMILNSEHVLLFKLLNQLMDKKYFVLNDDINKNEEVLWFKHLSYHQNSSFITLEETIQFLEQPLTRERIRQIRVKFIREFNSKFIKLCQIPIKYLQHYSVLRNREDYIYIDSALTNSINAKEKTSYTKLLITKIFGLFLSNTHVLIGDEIGIHKESKKRLEANLENLYLLSDTLYKQLRWNDFLNDIHLRKAERLEDNYSLNFKGYLFDFISDEDVNLTLIQNTAEDIIFREFNLVIVDNCLIFERSTKKMDWEYAHEVLQELPPLQEGYHVATISNAINKRYPDHVINESFHTSLLRYKDIFKPVGRASSYILVQWELDFPETIKGGDIRDIVEEFLKMKGTPQHIGEITDYVQKFRPNTYLISVSRNLNAESNNIFKFYKNGFIGLSHNSFDSLDHTLRVPFENQIENFINYLQLNNNRLPSSDKNSQIMQFYNTYRSELLRNRLSEKNQELMNSVDWKSIEETNFLLKTWDNNYLEIKNMLENQQKIDRRKNYRLYGWFKTQIRKLKANILDARKRDLLQELLKIYK